MELLVLSSMAKVFSDEKPSNPILHKASLLQNERFSFLLAFCSETGGAANISLEGTFADTASFFLVEEVPSELPVYKDSDSYYLRREPGLFPDVLRPITKSFSLYLGKWQSVWVQLDPQGKVPAGKHAVQVKMQKDGAAWAEAFLELEVIGAHLPEQTLTVTSWFHSDCLMNRYQVDVFSEEYWRITEEYVKTYVCHGNNMLLTPLFTPALDTMPGEERPTVQLVDVCRDGDVYTFGFEKLTRWVEMAKRCGVRYFELSHLFTQWGAKNAPKIMGTKDGCYKRLFGWETRAAGRAYTEFLTQFAAALTVYLDENRLRDSCFLHVSDEPSSKQYRSYKKKADMLKRLFPGFPLLDALSDFKFYEKGVTQIPIPAVDHAEAFMGKVPQFWTYYCCGQHKEFVPNRLMAMPGERTRVLGFQLYNAGAAGFLQWGYNFWNTRLSQAVIDPFRVTDAGKAFPSGDAFVVYPGEDGSAIPSLRLKLCYEAFQDQRALQLLEKLAGRETALQVLCEGLEEPLSFKQYPHSEQWLRETRERINQKIAQWR